MRVVLYAHDMEPITILELSEWPYQFLQKHGTVRLAVIPPINMSSVSRYGMTPDEPIAYKCWHVEITAEKLHRNGEVHLMLFTHNEEQAMLLKSAFLPGQRAALKEHEREAFAKGFLRAIQTLG
jgi:hypothetical protein